MPFERVCPSSACASFGIRVFTVQPDLAGFFLDDNGWIGLILTRALGSRIPDCSQYFARRIFMAELRSVRSRVDTPGSMHARLDRVCHTKGEPNRADSRRNVACIGCYIVLTGSNVTQSVVQSRWYSVELIVESVSAPRHLD